MTFKFEYDTASNGVAAPEVAYKFTVSTNGAESACADAIKNNTNIKWYLDDALAEKPRHRVMPTRRIKGFSLAEGLSMARTR